MNAINGVRLVTAGLPLPPSLLTTPDPFACLKCRRGFPDRRSLKAHQKTDCLSVPHICPHCHKEYCSEGNLKRHVSTVHNGVRPFACPVCPNMFTQKGHMTAHVTKIHCQDKTAAALAVAVSLRTETGCLYNLPTS